MLDFVHSTDMQFVWVDQTFAGQDEWMEELLGDEYYVELFAEIAESEPITEAIDEVPLSIPATKVSANVVMDGVETPT